MKRIKVCIISPKAYPVLNPKIKAIFGGAEVEMAIYAEELSKNPQLEIHLIVADYGQPECIRHGNIRVWKCFDFNKSIISNGIKFIKIIKTKKLKRFNTNSILMP